MKTNVGSSPDSNAEVTKMECEPHITRGAVIAESQWIVKLTRYESGEIVMSRTNDGFTIWELMGIVEFVKDELIKQHAGAIMPDEIKRTFVKP